MSLGSAIANMSSSSHRAVAYILIEKDQSKKNEKLASIASSKNQCSLTPNQSQNAASAGQREMVISVGTSRIKEYYIVWS